LYHLGPARHVPTHSYYPHHLCCHVTNGRVPLSQCPRAGTNDSIPQPAALPRCARGESHHPVPSSLSLFPNIRTPVFSANASRAFPSQERAFPPAEHVRSWPAERARDMHPTSVARSSSVRAEAASCGLPGWCRPCGRWFTLSGAQSQAYACHARDLRTVLLPNLKPDMWFPGLPLGPACRARPAFPANAAHWLI